MEKERERITICNVFWSLNNNRFVTTVRVQLALGHNRHKKKDSTYKK